ncbi:hypothetical protein [Trueperella pyogenes]|uniref:hypothetical protein n=1 Tax=Trueperella pyogenes TaxID=1661 RepID=UPI000A50FE17|nr:hypothetical protein [Trueperella pyogenes]
MISTLARPLLAAPFVASGIDAMLHPESHRGAAQRIVGVLDRVGVPAADLPLDALTRATGAVVATAGLPDLCSDRGRVEEGWHARHG